MLTASEQGVNNLKFVLPQRQGRHLALTVLYVPHSLDSGSGSMPTSEAHTSEAHTSITAQVIDAQVIDANLQTSQLQGYLAHKKLPPPRTLQ